MKTESISHGAVGAKARSVGCATLRGVEQAVEFARSGRIISAIKHIEAENPAITREQAKAFVQAFGYGREARWPEQQRLPVRCL